MSATDSPLCEPLIYTIEKIDKSILLYLNILFCFRDQHYDVIINSLDVQLFLMEVFEQLNNVILDKVPALLKKKLREDICVCCFIFFLHLIQGHFYFFVCRGFSQLFIFPGSRLFLLYSVGHNSGSKVRASPVPGLNKLL
jgi:hypothetical protein